MLVNRSRQGPGPNLVHARSFCRQPRKKSKLRRGELVSREQFLANVSTPAIPRSPRVPFNSRPTPSLPHVSAYSSVMSSGPTSAAGASSAPSSAWDRMTTWASENKTLVYSVAGVAIVVTGAGAVYYFSQTASTPEGAKKRPSKKERRRAKKEREAAEQGSGPATPTSDSKSAQSESVFETKYTDSTLFQLQLPNSPR